MESTDPSRRPAASRIAARLWAPAPEFFRVRSTACCWGVWPWSSGRRIAVVMSCSFFLSGCCWVAELGVGFRVWFLHTKIWFFFLFRIVYDRTLIIWSSGIDGGWWLGIRVFCMCELAGYLRKRFYLSEMTFFLELCFQFQFIGVLLPLLVVTQLKILFFFGVSFNLVW